MIHCCAFPSETLCPNSEPCELHALRERVKALTARVEAEARALHKRSHEPWHSASFDNCSFLNCRKARLALQGGSQ